MDDGLNALWIKLFLFSKSPDEVVRAKVGQSRCCQNVPKTCMLVDGAYGNTMQQKKWANDAN